MNEGNAHFGPVGAMNDVAREQGNPMEKVLGEEYKPKELVTFNEDRERALNAGAFPIQDGTQYPLAKVNVNGNEDYGSIKDAY